jgi:hypothetical protein
MMYTCCTEHRREEVIKHPSLNGIDYLEVLDLDAPKDSPRQQTLLLRLLKPALDDVLRKPILNASNLRINGGERFRNIVVEWAYPASALPPDLKINDEERTYFRSLSDPDSLVVIRINSYGDYSTYKLSLVRSDSDIRPPQGFDPRLAELEFSFKVECTSDFDCQDKAICTEQLYPVPDINYLAKDYASFRRLILDRLTQLVPGWRERSVADLGVTLAELLAYVGDQLSYQQDAVATEAYLETARRRTSLRRHAILVDYKIHEGCNARTWVHVEIDPNTEKLSLPLSELQFLTKVPDARSQIPPRSQQYESALAANPIVFEPVPLDENWPIPPAVKVTFYAAHNKLHFYTWGDQRCCLRKGATAATLHGHLPSLKKNDVLIFEEVIGPLSGESGDADLAHRHVVRLAQVIHSETDDQGSHPLTDPLTGKEITEIEWFSEDALPFPLCISSQTDAEHGGAYIDNVSVARGNVLLADHGLSIKNEDLGVVPADKFYPSDRDSNRCEEENPIRMPLRFHPALREGPLTHQATVLLIRTKDSSQKQVPFDLQSAATRALATRDDEALPMIRLFNTSTDGKSDSIWMPKRELLNSSGTEKHFVVEIEEGGTAFLRFGDDQHGLRPDPGTNFKATYRIGNGISGNIGADAIAHVVCADARVLAARNPLSARSGMEPETTEQIRRRAPQAFRKQERAVTLADYQEVTERHTAVQRAQATLRWTGSWHTVFITVDRFGGKEVDERFKTELERHVERYRMAGQDVEIDSPIHVSLEITLEVCIKADYFRSDVRKRLMDVFSNRVLTDGSRGIFHPDNFSFGQTLYASSIYAAARGVAGVASVRIAQFERQGIKDDRFLTDGQITLGRLEIARLDNDPNFPEHGSIHFELFGGK